MSNIALPEPPAIIIHSTTEQLERARDSVQKEGNHVMAWAFDVAIAIRRQERQDIGLDRPGSRHDEFKSR